MAKKNLRLLKIADFKLVPAQQKPTYVFVKANDEMIGQNSRVFGTFSNTHIIGFANSIGKITMDINHLN